jgi:hypothetical protein
LDGLEEELGRFDAGVVVDAGGVDLEHLAPEHLLGGADVADASEELFEVAFGTGARRVLRRPWMKPFTRYSRRRSAAQRRNWVPRWLRTRKPTARGVQPVVFDLAGNRAISFTSNL